MYEESESERYRAKLKDEYEVFVRNQDVYATLKKLDGFQMVMDTALLIFHCPADQLEMDELNEMEKFLKMAKNRYHAIVSSEDLEANISISSEEDVSERHQDPVEPEINWRMPRNIPEVSNNNNLAPTIPNANHQQSINQHQSMNQQNMMHQTTANVNYQQGLAQTVPAVSYQQNLAPTIPYANQHQSMNQQNMMHQTIANVNYQQGLVQTVPAVSYQQNLAQTVPNANYQQSINHQQNTMHHQNINPQQNMMPQTITPMIIQQSMNPQHNMPTPSNPWNNFAPNYGTSPTYPASTIQNISVNPSTTVQSAGRFVAPSGYMFNQPQHLPNVQHNLQVPSTSRQMPPEKPEVGSFREYRLKKLQDEQKEKERREKQRKLLQKMQEEEQQNIMHHQNIIPQQNMMHPLSIPSHIKRQKQITEYNKREAEELAAGTSSKQSESGKSSRFSGSFRKEGKKSVTWADIESNKSLTSMNTGENNTSTSCEDSGSAGSSKNETQSEKGKKDQKSTSTSKTATQKANEKFKKALKADLSNFFSVKKATENNDSINKSCEGSESAGSSKNETQSEKGKKSTSTSKTATHKKNEKLKKALEAEMLIFFPVKTATPLTSMDTSENNVSINTTCKDNGSASASSSSSSKNETQSKKGKKASKAETSKSQKSDSNKKTDKNKNNDKVSTDRNAIKKGILQVYHPKPIPLKLLKDTDSLIKRKSEGDPIYACLTKRSKKGSDGENNVPATSDCDIRDKDIIDINIKVEQMSDDEDFDGKTDVSSTADSENVESATVQRIESDHIRIKCEPEEDLDSTATTVENIDIKDEVMSEIDNDNSSIHSEKEEINEITENFVNVCENPDFLHTITENLIDLSHFENDMTDAIQNNNNNNSKAQMDSQERCASWVEGIINFDRNLESPENQSIQDEQFYLTKDEEAEPDDYIVPYYPVRQLGEPEMVPKEEEF